MRNAIFILFLITACSSTENGAYSKSTFVENNLTTSIKSPWSAIESEGSDLALSNGLTKSIFLFNSACRKNEASNLSVLTNSILTGIDKVEYLDKSNVIHQGREASITEAKGSIDGVERYFRILTTQKNNCIYDYALISTTKTNLIKDTADFNKFIQLIKLN
jgi:hypothetical protein